MYTVYTSYTSGGEVYTVYTSYTAVRTLPFAGAAYLGGQSPLASASWRSFGCSSYHVFSDSSVIW